MRTFTFSMGLPGAGKSTVVAQRRPSAKVICPDAIKASHPDYDPANPAPLHQWSRIEADKAFTAALSEGGEWVLDGTGTNVEPLVKKMRQAKAAGFEVTLLFVTVSLETALERNASRARHVPEQIVREKAETIYTAFEIAAHEADKVEVVWNE